MVAFSATSSLVLINSAVTIRNLASFGDVGAFAFSASVGRCEVISVKVSPPKSIRWDDTKMVRPTAFSSFLRFRTSAAVISPEFLKALPIAT